MANRYAVATGNWSNTATWDGGTLPQAGDVVRPNGYTVTIDQNITVTELRDDASSPAVANGTFILTSGVTITANITHTSTTTSLITYSANAPAVAAIVGAINSTGNKTIYGVVHSGSGTLNITGNVSASANQSKALSVTGAGILNLVGSPVNNNTASVGMLVSGAATVTITGNIIATNTDDGNAGDTYALYVTATNAVINITGNISYRLTSRADKYAVVVTGASTLNITGNIVPLSASAAGPSLFVTAAATVNVTGDITASSAAPGISCTGGATINHISGILYPSGNRPAINNTSYSATVLLQGALANNGSVMPFYSPVMAITSSPLSWIVRGPTVGSTRTLYTLDALPTNYTPAVTNVRSGITYNQGASTGTLVVPSSQYVALGVPVDATVGTLQYLSQSDLQAALQPNAQLIVERSTNDTKAITFSWPVSGATITGQKSIDNGAYAAVVGAISFLRTESNRHYYALAYNAADRNTVESSIRYKMTDGTYTKYFNLHVVPSGDVNVTLAPLAADQEPRNTRTRIIVYTGEAGTQYFFARDSQNNNLNLTGFNLELRFARGKSVIYTAKTTDGSLTISNGNQVNFARSSALTRGDGELTYALRDMGSGAEVLLEGPVTVRYAP